jgi:hypothetical protein
MVAHASHNSPNQIAYLTYLVTLLLVAKWKQKKKKVDLPLPPDGADTNNR